MKKRNLKSLSLNKKSISRLFGGNGSGNEPTIVTLEPYYTQGYEPGCIMYSECPTSCCSGDCRPPDHKVSDVPTIC